MELNKVISVLQNINKCRVLSCWPLKTKEEVRPLYPQLTDDLFNKLWYGTELCQGIANRFERSLREVGITSKRLFAYLEDYMYEPPKVPVSFNKTITDLVSNLKYAEANEAVIDCFGLELENRGKQIPFTHALTEVWVGNKYIVADPYVGIVYPYTKEELIRVPELAFSAWLYNDQITYLKHNMHTDNATLVSATPHFWRKVSRLTHAANGDIPSCAV